MLDHLPENTVRNGGRGEEEQEKRRKAGGHVSRKGHIAI